MVKKIRFALSLPDGTQARSLDDLKEHFDLEAVLGHYKSGKLLKWLQDRYLEDEASAVEALDEGAPDFQQKLCAVFGVEFSGSNVDMEEIARHQERLAKLRKYTDGDEFIQNIDFVAFDQEELADLLDEDCEKIYLCGEKFSVPASVRDKIYIGVNEPKVRISGTIDNDWAAWNIVFSGCEVENLPASAQETASIAAEDDGPVVISDELASDIFDTIYENVPGGCHGGEIIAETDHYYVIEKDSYLRFSKTSCTFEELPDLRTFSVASKYYKLGRTSHSLGNMARFAFKRSAPPMLSAPTYQYKDILYMQEISDEDNPSIWCLDLNTKSLTKLMDGIRFFCPRLPALTFPCDGRYIPVIKNKKFCVIDLQSLDLIKVRNKGQWMDIPYGAVVVRSKVYFTVDETQVGRSDEEKGAFCSFDLELQKFSEEDVIVQASGESDKTLTMHTQFASKNPWERGYRFNLDSGLGLWSQGNQIIMFLAEHQGFVLDTFVHPMCAQGFLYNSGNYTIIWGDKMVKLHPKENASLLTMLDLTSPVENDPCLEIALSAYCKEIFARIGDFIYTYNRISKEGYRISLTEPYERVPFTMNTSALNDDLDYDWKPIPST